MSNMDDSIKNKLLILDDHKILIKDSPLTTQNIEDIKKLNKDWSVSTGKFPEEFSRKMTEKQNKMKVENLVQSEAYYYGRDIENNVKGAVVQYLYHNEDLYSFTDNTQNGEFHLKQEEVEKDIQVIEELKVDNVHKKEYEVKLDENKEYTEIDEVDPIPILTVKSRDINIHFNRYDILAFAIKQEIEAIKGDDKQLGEKTEITDKLIIDRLKSRLVYLLSNAV